MFEPAQTAVFRQRPEEHPEQREQLDRAGPRLLGREFDSALAAHDLAEAFHLTGCQAEGEAVVGVAGHAFSMAHTEASSVVGERLGG